MSPSDPLLRTFQLSRGIGPWREKDLWARGITSWDELEREIRAAPNSVMSKKLDAEFMATVELARAAVTAGDLRTLAKMIPVREHWRLYPRFAQRAGFFDLEADGEDEITVAGVMDREGLGTFIRGTSLEQFPERLARSEIWVTFNGAVFDVPVTLRHFPQLQLPAVHIDLRVVLRKVKMQGGLKEIEERLGLHRPPHLKGLKGTDAIRLWREHQINRHPDALKWLVEYNLYDSINLRSLLEWSVNEISDALSWTRERTPVFERGEVLYDLSRLVMSL